MKYYILFLALCLLIALALTSSPAGASRSSVDMPVTASFQIAGVAKAVDNVSGEFSPGPGKIDITRGDHASYIRVLASAPNGTRLISLDDYESGIVFRNNTMLLPLYAAGEKTGSLVVATDNLIADTSGYAGMITGLELDSGKITAARNGHNFTAGTALSLTDLPAGATYRVAFTDNASLSEAVSADLEAYGQAAAVASPVLAVSTSVPAAGDMVGFVIVTVEADGDWTGPYGDKNITFYRYAGGQLSRLRFTTARSENGTLTYQAISPGTGLFLIAAPAPRDEEVETVTASASDVVLLGGLLVILVIALLVMVRRVAK
ncbi:MAG TPA: hypothetical protein VGJ92_11745 [Methanocella sp.]|jgi:hypothetical protein